MVHIRRDTLIEQFTEGLYQIDDIDGVLEFEDEVHMTTALIHKLENAMTEIYLDEKNKELTTIQNMVKYGGSFVSALADAIKYADAENYAKLKKAFPLIFEKYANMETGEKK